MSNVMAYMLEMSDEFRERYEEINKKAEEILDKLTILESKVQEIEIRINPNRQD